MNRFRDEERKRLTELTVNGRNCTGKLKEELAFAESILRLSEQCRKYETEREKVLPFYQGTALEAADVENLTPQTLQPPHISRSKNCAPFRVRGHFGFSQKT